MNSGRLAGLWGVLFPLGALVLFVVLLSLGARTTVPAGPPGQTSAASQTTAQSGGNTSGGGSMATSSSQGGSTTTGTPGTMAAGGTAAMSPSTGASTSNETASAAPSNTAQANTSAPAGSTAVQAAANGAQVYSANCASCHGPAGAGVPGAFPPLAGNRAILGGDKYVSDVLLYGLQGQIGVAGQNYNGVMPAWAAILSDAQIAAVLTHIRSTWGNSAPAVAEATVKTERATPLSAAQILAERPQ